MTSIEPEPSYTSTVTTTLTPRPWCVSRWLRRILGCPCRRLAYRFLAMAAVGLFIVGTDGWSAASALKTSLNRAVVHLETRLAPPPPDSDVTVLLWTDAALAGLKQQGIVERQWPIGYTAHAMLLNTLVDFKPAAVFLDFAFLTGRADPGMQDFIEAVRYVADSGIPVFIACVPGAGIPAFRELWDAVEHNAGVHFVPANIPDDSVVQMYPVYVERHARTADAAAPWTSDCILPGGAAPTVAPSIYNALRASAKIPHGHHPQDIGVDDPPMSLVFDTRITPATTVYFTLPGQPSACSSGSPPPVSGLLDLLWGLFVDPEALRIPRAGPPMIPVDAVIYESPGAAGREDTGQPADDRPEICRRPMDDFLLGRVVMIGSNLTAAEDFRDTLIDRAQPGVLVHATAFQNLVQYGVHYPRTEVVLRSGDRIRFMSSTALVIAYVLLLSALHADFMQRRERFADSRQLLLDNKTGSEARAGFLAFRFLPTLAAFVFLMDLLDIRPAEILYVAIALQILKSPLAVWLPNAVLIDLMYRTDQTPPDE